MKKIIIPILFLLPLLVSAQSVRPLSVTFNPNPLFSASNFLPGDNKEANITVGNNSDALQNAYIEAVKVLNDDNLASQMNIKIFEDSNPTPFYDSNFSTFLNAGPVLLSDIGIGGSKTYNLKITFIEATGNDYQGKTLGFDICVGFSGGSQTCTGEPVTDDGGDGGTNGTTGGDADGIGGDLEGGARTNLGGHRSFVPGEAVLSAATVGTEAFGGEGGGEVLGASTGSGRAPSGTVSEENILNNGGVALSSNYDNLAAVVTSGLGNILSICSLIALLILLIGYLIWKFILRPKYEKIGLREEEIKQKFFGFFAIFSVLATVVAYILNQYCPIPIFLLVLIFSVISYVYYLFK